jgi:hypothetical protein
VGFLFNRPSISFNRPSISQRLAPQLASNEEPRTASTDLGGSGVPEEKRCRIDSRNSPTALICICYRDAIDRARLSSWSLDRLSEDEAIRMQVRTLHRGGDPPQMSYQIDVLMREEAAELVKG